MLAIIKVMLAVNKTPTLPFQKHKQSHLKNTNARIKKHQHLILKTPTLTFKRKINTRNEKNWN